MKREWRTDQRRTAYISGRSASRQQPGLGDRIGASLLLPGRHQVRAGDALDLRQFLQQFDADAAAFGALVLRSLQTRDQRLRHVYAEQMLVHPARRLGGSERP